MRATGFGTYPYKLAAFTISGGIAGLAGFLFAVKDGFVNPELMSWHFSGAVLIMIGMRCDSGTRWYGVTWIGRTMCPGW